MVHWAVAFSGSGVTYIFSSTVPSRPPSSVKATLIEEDTALVSWKPPDDPNSAVTHYTVLYASRHDWLAGEWQELQREGKEVLQVCRNKASTPQRPQAIGNHYLIPASNLCWSVIPEWCWTGSCVPDKRPVWRLDVINTNIFLCL